MQVYTYAAASPAVEVIIFDGAAIINMLPPGPAKTFNDYASQVFLQHITSQLQYTSRVDIIWDEYLTDSLKAGTRKKQGKGIGRRVEPSSSIPGNWQTFLRTDENKMELFDFLATTIATTNTDKQSSAPTTKMWLVHRSEMLLALPLVATRMLIQECYSMLKML